LGGEIFFEKSAPRKLRKYISLVFKARRKKEACVAKETSNKMTILVPSLENDKDAQPAGKGPEGLPYCLKKRKKVLVRGEGGKRTFYVKGAMKVVEIGRCFRKKGNSF